MMATKRTGWTPTLCNGVAHLDGESRRGYVDKVTQLGINDPCVFLPEMFTDILKF